MSTKWLLMADEELAGIAQNGSKDAEEALVGRYWELAGIIARSFAIPGVEVEDKESECLGALVKAAREWRTGRGTKFKTFAKMLMGRALIEVWRDVHAAGEVPRRKLVSMEQSLDDSGETSLEELLASTDDPVGIVMDRAAIREAASHLSTTQRRHISEAVRGNQACERLVRAVEAFASGLLSPTLHADLVDLIRSDGTQPVLIHLGPEPSSQEAQDLVASVLRSYDETQWCVICDIAEGYEPEEIARRRKIPTEVVSLMVGACRSTVSA